MPTQPLIPDRGQVHLLAAIAESAGIMLQKFLNASLTPTYN